MTQLGDALQTGEPVVVTQELLELPWAGNKRNFRCHFCGSPFELGERFRWIFTNDIPKAGGNPLACEACGTDREALRQKWVAMHEEFKAIKQRFWAFIQQENIAADYERLNRRRR